jgi:type II secretory pathway pseudopilin PulG
MRTVESKRPVSDEAGFGLVEIVVAMLMLALLSVSFLPLLITAFKTSINNSTVTTSTQLVNQELELATTTAASTPTCGLLKTFANSSTIGTTTARDGTVLQPHRQLLVKAGKTDAQGCPLVYPGTAYFRSWITASSGSTVYAEATTLLYVTAATP